MRSPELLPVLGALIVLVTPRHAFAYLDPGTGSYLIQMAAAGLFAGMFTLKMYWTNLKMWIQGKRAAAKTDEPK